jgi:hypothetical protein
MAQPDDWSLDPPPVRSVRARLLSSDKELRRFRLPELPEEPHFPRPTEGRWRWLAYAGSWVLFCALCLVIAPGGLAPSWLARRLPSALAAVVPTQQLASRRNSGPDSAELSRPVDTSERAQAPGALAATRTAPLAFALPSLRRRAPATHGGGWGIARQDSTSELSGFPELASAVLDEAEEPQASSAAALSGPSSDRTERGRHRATASASRAPAEPSGPDDVSSSRAAAKQRVWTATGGQGCQAAYDAHGQHVDVAAKATTAPDIPQSAYASVLEDFSNYGRCQLDYEMDVSICVAVLDGKARGVTVKTQPANARLASCVATAVERLRYPKSPRIDLVRTELIVR